MPISRTRRAENLKDLFRSIFEMDMPESMAIDAFDAMTEQAYLNTMWYWFDNILPTNFQAGAAQRRSYPPLNRKYHSYKWKLTGKDGMARPHFVVSGPAGPKRPKQGMPHIPNWRDVATTRPDRAPRVKRTRGGMSVSMVVYVPLYVRQNRSIPNMGRLATQILPEDNALMDEYFAGQLIGFTGINPASSARTRSA